MGEAVLHDYWRSSAAYRVRIVLNLKGILWRGLPLDMIGGEHKHDDYTALNPQGLVPTLEIDGHVLTQSLAIIDYLDATHKTPAMVSADPARRARTLAQALIVAADIHPVNNMRILNALRSDFGASEEQVRLWVQRWIAEGFAALERMAPEAGLFGGDMPDLADVCLVPQMYNARRFELDLTPYPRLVRIDAAARALDPVARAAPEAVRAG
ncbi:maleylacetoacetate isomerase [Novosphingobium sp. Gsoil 351]|uniref:maleylacetoacetate isomerase n=1 Tax=Novosphingobium sp. Gsoil 351 TaxID=2675225 RepID=UPI0012B4CBB7|nr:maleylacetoacetate isomerase [Novosphingobium sp. Gsoil 351]QGN55338.1 maleylacetoacetate isomerase [Novosphingobium sp. Gsoil 351]